jgi:hypothetical protein
LISIIHAHPGRNVGGRIAVDFAIARELRDDSSGVGTIIWWTCRDRRRATFRLD